LIYGNFNHGIALWDDANPYDAAYVDPGPASPGQVKGPDDLPLWGCQQNIIRNNTVLMNNPDRAAMQCRNGSWGTRMRNNIFINGQPSSVEVFNTSIYRLDSSFDVINTLSYTGMSEALKNLAVQLPEGRRRFQGLRRKEPRRSLSATAMSRGSSLRASGGGSIQVARTSVRAQIQSSLPSGEIPGTCRHGIWAGINARAPRLGRSHLRPVTRDDTPPSYCHSGCGVCS